MTPITPPIPATPSASSTAAEWDLYLRAVDAFNRVAQIDASLAHGKAQADTAVALKEAAAAQQAMATAMADMPSGGFSESFVLSLLGLVLDKPMASGG